jgi:putative NADH-flavin reductase
MQAAGGRRLVVVSGMHAAAFDGHPEVLSDGPRTGAYRTGPPLRFGLRSRIARADVAELMLRQVDQDTHLRQVVRVSG